MQHTEPSTGAPSRFARTTRCCPTCGYDVGTTLADGFNRCPECGGEVTEETCRIDVRVVPAQWWWWVTGASFAPVIVGTASTFVAAAIDLPPLAPAGFIIAIVLMAAAWWKVERWIEPRASRGLAAARVVGWVLTFLLPNLVVMGVVVCGVGTILNW